MGFSSKFTVWAQSFNSIMEGNKKSKLVKKPKKGGKGAVVDSETSAALPPSPRIVEAPPSSPPRSSEPPDTFLEGRTSIIRVISPVPSEDPSAAIRVLSPIPVAPASDENPQQTIARLESERAFLIESLKRLEADAHRTGTLLQDRTLQVQDLEEQVRSLRRASRSSQFQADHFLSQGSSSEGYKNLERDLEITRQTVDDLRSELERSEGRVRELEEYIQSDDLVEVLESSLKAIQDRAESREFQLSKISQALGKGKSKRDSFAQKSRAVAASNLERRSRISFSGFSPRLSNGYPSTSKAAHTVGVEAITEGDEIPPSTLAYFEMAMHWYNLMTQQRMSSDVRWRDQYEGPSHAHFWLSTITLKGRLLARAKGRTREESRDKAAYSALTEVQIPLLYPDDSYPYLNCTLKLNDRLTSMGRTEGLSWESDRINQKDGKGWVSSLFIDGELYGRGSGPALICARDMACYEALEKLGRG